MSRSINQGPKAPAYGAAVTKKAEEIEAERRVRGHLRQQMAQRNINQAELARRLKTSEAVVSLFLSGERGLKVWLILRICRSLGFTATHLLEEDPPARYLDDPSPNDSVKKK